MAAVSARTETLRNFGLAIIVLGFIIVALVYGSPFLMPLAVAVFIWNILEAMIQGFSNIRPGTYKLPRWLATFLGFSSVTLGFYLIWSILAGQADALSSAWPRYAARLGTVVSDLTQWLGPEFSEKLRRWVAAIDLTKTVPGLIASTQSIVFSTLLVIAYVAFLFVERIYLNEKLMAMFSDAPKAREARALFSGISERVRQYIWIKTLVSVLTGVSCYVVLRGLGIDFAETWALLIFLLNYIPTLGSIVAVAFPAVIALVQFETAGTFLILLLSLTAIQLAIGSVLEPVLMGKSLNISPLAIVLSLSFWGMIWGIIGMFLCVPILVTVLVICAHVPSWRWVAILLSKDGQIPA